MPSTPPSLDFGRVFEASPNAYMILDRDLRYVAANAAYLEVAGARLEDLLGRGLLEVFPNDPDDPNNESALRLRASLERVLATGIPDTLAHIPYRVPRTLGGPLEERTWSASHVPLRDERGDVRWVLQHTVDVTELARLEAATKELTSMGAGVVGRADVVQRSNDLLRGLFEQAPGFMCFLRGAEHRFELANDAYYAIVGQREILGKTVRDALPEVEGQGFFELLDRVFATGEPYVGRAAVIQLQRVPDAAPEERWLDFVYQPIVDHAGAVQGIFVQGHDITEQKRLEEEREALLAREREARAEAERANVLKDEFLATVSHELRTPLNAMLGWVQLLRGGALAPEKRETALDVIARNAQAQAKLVDDLLDLSRILAGKLHLELEAVDLAAIAHAAAESVAPAASAKQITVITALAQTSVRGDPERLQQIVWNLLSNAVKFSPPGGRIELTIAKDDASVEIAVADRGRGIAPEFLPHVFERFRQADGRSTRAHGGLGLGLAIVKQLVDLHGGTVSAESAGEGRGATFRVRLPRAVAPRSIADAMGAADFPHPPQLSGATVLVVDDDADARELVSTVLGVCGAEVLTAASVAEAFETFCARRPDLVVSDIAMPGEDGYAFIGRIRALPPDAGGKTPAVALTAHARAEDRTRALLAGFRAHVPKPIEPAELVAVLAALAPSP